MSEKINKMEIDKEYLQRYEDELTQKLLRQAHDLRCGAEQLYQTEDLEEMWHKIAPQYMVDAVPEIAQYPTVAIAWAGYIGMGLAHLWDKDWAEVFGREDVYASLRDPRGFDEMDEYIIEGVMGYLLDSKTAQGFENLMRSLSQTALAQIRHEEIEPQSEMAFHVFARTTKVMFRIGVSCELYRLGYKYEKM